MMKRISAWPLMVALLSLCACAAQWLLGAGSTYIAAANTVTDAQVMTSAGTVTRTNDAAISTRNLLYKEGAAPGSGAAVCGAADLPLGVIDNTESATDQPQAVFVLGRYAETIRMVAAEAIAIGEEVFTGESGKVQNRPTASGTYWMLGVALSAAGAANDVLVVNHCVPQKLVIA